MEEIDNPSKEEPEKELPKVENIAVKKGFNDIDIELVKKMVEWDRRNHVLESWKFQIMQDVAIGLRPLTGKL